MRAGARIIGVNNRNLKDFTVDIHNSERLRELVPGNIVFVSESGIKTPEDVGRLYQNKTDAVLIGETLMRSSNKKAELEEKEYVVTSGGGMVEITAKGDHTIKAIGINPEVVDPEDVEMLEDMLVAAFNEAMRQIDEESERELEKVTGGLNIPGL
mgnify:FL=1